MLGGLLRLQRTVLSGAGSVGQAETAAARATTKYWDTQVGGQSAYTMLVPLRV